MMQPLQTREFCHTQLRACMRDDVFLLRYALLLACEQLDLDQLNRLVDSVDDMSRAAMVQANLRLTALVEERRLRSRLS